MTCDAWTPGPGAAWFPAPGGNAGEGGGGGVGQFAWACTRHVGVALYAEQAEAVPVAARGRPRSRRAAVPAAYMNPGDSGFPILIRESRLPG